MAEPAPSDPPGGFVALSATLASTPTVPIAGLTLLLGIDRFMSEARAICNLIGNGVAIVAVSAWEKEFDHAHARRVLPGESTDLISLDSSPESSVKVA